MAEVAQPAERMPELMEIVGQDAAVGRLQRAMHGGRMPHALLLVGARGVGRRTTALALARALLCEQPVETPNAGRLAELDAQSPTTEACGRCPACRLARADNHPDLHVIYKELARYHDDPAVRGRVMQDLGIGVIRQFLLAPAAAGSTRGRGKVFVVREADLMSPAAQNALLKTLEEPPPGVTIVLLATQPEEMLPTTVSRCSVIRFGPLPGDFVADSLRRAGVADEPAAFLAAFCEGSVGRALELAQQDIYTIKLDLLDRLAGLDLAGDAELGEYLLKLSDSLADQAVKRVKAESEVEMSKNLAARQATGTLLGLIASVYRDALAVSTGLDRTLVHADQPAAVQAVAERLGSDRLADVLDQLGTFEYLLWRNANARVLWANVAITLANAAALTL